MKKNILLIFIAAFTVMLTIGEARHREKEDHEEKTIISSVKSLDAVQISLIDAVNTALKEVPGKAVEANLYTRHGYLLFSVEIIAENKIIEIIIDPGNANILSKETEDYHGLKKDNDDEDDDD